MLALAALASAALAATPADCTAHRAWNTAALGLVVFDGVAAGTAMVGTIVNDGALVRAGTYGFEAGVVATNAAAVGVAISGRCAPGSGAGWAAGSVSVLSLSVPLTVASGVLLIDGLANDDTGLLALGGALGLAAGGAATALGAHGLRRHERALATVGWAPADQGVRLVVSGRFGRG